MSNLYVSDLIFDHRVLHVSLTCNRAHPERKQIDVRSLNHIKCDVLEADLIGVNIARECTDVNLVVCNIMSLSIRSIVIPLIKSQVLTEKCKKIMDLYQTFLFYPKLLRRLFLFIFMTYFR